MIPPRLSCPCAGLACSYQQPHSDPRHRQQPRDYRCPPLGHFRSDWETRDVAAVGNKAVLAVAAAGSYSCTGAAGVRCGVAARLEGIPAGYRRGPPGDAAVDGSLPSDPLSLVSCSHRFRPSPRWRARDRNAKGKTRWVRNAHSGSVVRCSLLLLLLLLLLLILAAP